MRVIEFLIVASRYAKSLCWSLRKCLDISARRMTRFHRAALTLWHALRSASVPC
jgi:hypothetical protein